MGLANLPDSVTTSDGTAGSLVGGGKPNPPTGLTATLVTTYIDERGHDFDAVVASA